MPSPVTLFNAEDHIIRTGSGNQFLMQDLPGNEQITLGTPGGANQLNLNASANPGITLGSSQGQINVTAQKDFNQKTQANYNQTVGTDHTVTVNNDIKLTVQQDIKQEVQETTSTLANNQASLESQTGELTVTSGKDTILHAEGSVNLTAEQKLTIQNTGGDLLFKGKKFTAKGKTIIFEVGEASLTLTPDGIITFRGTQVDMYNQSTQQADKSMFGGTPAKGKEPTPPEVPQINNIESNTTKGDIIKVAKAWEGTPYAFSEVKGQEKIPENFAYRGPNAKKGNDGAGDCSGTTYAIYKEAGYEYDYASTENFIETSGSHKFKEITLDEAKPGDVVTWCYEHSYIDKKGIPRIEKGHHMAIINTIGKNSEGKADESKTHIWTTHESGERKYNGTNTIKVFNDDLHKRHRSFNVAYWHYEGYNDGK